MSRQLECSNASGYSVPEFLDSWTLSPMRTAQRRRLAMGSFFVGVCMLMMLTTQSTDARITREDIRRAHLAVRERGGTSSPVADLRCEADSLPTAPEGAVKFFALGDWGVRGLDVGSEAQLDVARGISCAARAIRPRFIVTLGDNFYPKGVTSENDRQFSFKFEEVYRDDALHVPWFPSLGDHDHLGDVNAQSMYSLKSDRWSMTRAWYVEVIPLTNGGKLQLIFVDWVALEGRFSVSSNDRRFQKHLGEAAGKDTSEEHWEWLRRVTSSSNPTWRVVIGHRPLISVSARSAKDDERYPAEGRARSAIREFIEGADVDLWINGHDHTAQVACSERGGGTTHFVTSGIGGYDLHALRPREEWEETLYAENGYHGFTAHIATDDTLTTHFMDERGRVRHSVDIRKDSSRCNY